jgi:hypothetical protein
MDWEISFDEKENILFVKTRGIMDIDTHKTMMKECLKMSKEKNCGRWLIDNSEITSQRMGTFDIHSVPQLFDGFGFSPRLQIAEVSLKKYANDFGFLETVCRNRGYALSVFYDVESALQWLKQ